jgi:hypothetical protein
MEWNNGAITFIFIMFLIPFGIIYFLLKIIIKFSPSLTSFIQREKQDRILVYIIIEIGLLILAIGLTIAILSFISTLRGGRGILE